MATVTLRQGGLHCDVRPDLGGCIAGLWCDGLPVLRSTPGDTLHSVRECGSFPLVPFSNRIGQATLLWQGTGHPLVTHALTEAHAIHGVGWMRPWAVLEQSDRFLLLAHEHRAEPHWPFAYDASQTLQLLDGALELTLSITNQSSVPAPVGLGWHPYFVKRPHSHLRFEASGRWDMGSDKLPTGHRPSPGLDTDCATLDVDHCFDGWAGVAHLRDEALDVRIRAPLRHLVVYTQPTRDFVAVEPVSHVNNAWSLHAQGHSSERLGLRVLAPGESFCTQMRLEVSARS
ncbi:aldose 1-epimerase [Hydrogenophaga atypica]|uniref:Aldose 1-epimerase n=1 Tax=Hydrogenophaga atypica TaxID=249409 RepID=A0ABW2QM98_9BURK